MSIIDTLVTDRGPGAWYGAADLNRVESAVQYLAEQLQAAPEDLQYHAAALGVAWDQLFDVPYNPAAYTPETKTDWTMQELPTKTAMERYLSNVMTLTAALEAAYPVLPDTMSNLTWTGANAIERALELLHGALMDETARITTLIDKAAASWYYTAETYAGEV